MNRDEIFMSKAIALAKKGIGKTSPNPLVGAVVVYKDTIIGEGFHEYFGGPHAEVNAINSVEDKSLLPQSTLYVTLEPCSHFGKTPPCSDLICSKKFERVVIGMKDPHDKVAGKGIAQLKAQGIVTDVGVLEKECRLINKGFISSHERNRPYILLKYAETADGFIDDHYKPIHISGPLFDQKVQELRNEFQSILVGKNTVINDNPRLTCRLEGGTNPIRIVLDSKLSISGDYNVFDGEAPAIILNTVSDQQLKNLTYLKVDDMSIPTILSALHKTGINSILVEGGSTVLSNFISSGIWDEILVLTSNIRTQSGTLSPTISIEPDEVSKLGNDTLTRYINS